MVRYGYINYSFIFFSGGHTTELMRVMEALQPAYKPRLYLVAQTDKISESKIDAMENCKKRSSVVDVRFRFMLSKNILLNMRNF